MSEIFGRIGGARDEDGDRDVETADLRVDARGARWLRRRLAGGVVALTTRVADGFRASTLTACTVASIDPLQLLVSLELGGQMDGWLLQAEVFALNLLPWDQQLVADRFAGFGPLASTTFREIDHFFAETGAPILRKTIAWADCTIIQSFETGDHRCFIGQAVAIGRGEGAEDDPLVYFLNRYRRLR